MCKPSDLIATIITLARRIKLEATSDCIYSYVGMKQCTLSHLKIDKNVII